MRKQVAYYFCMIMGMTLAGCDNKLPEAVTKTGFVPVADSKLYYESTGKGEAIVLLHGGYMDRRMWDEQVKVFSKNYRVITCDLRGHGSTIDGDSSYLMYEAIRILLDSLHETKVNLAGLSLGAMIATDFAIAYPQYIKKLLLITPGLNKLDTVFAEDSSITHYSNLLREAVIEKKDTAMAAEYFIRCWFDGPGRSPEQTDTAARRKALSIAVSTMKTHKLLHWTRFSDPPAIERLNKITAATLIITGEKDNFRISKNAEALNKEISGSFIITIKNAAHLPNMEKPAEFNKIVLDFIRRQTN